MKIQSPTHFHLLNRCQHGQFFTVADTPGETCITAAGGAATLDQLKAVMSTSPTGTTPLTEAVQQVIRQIAPAADKLNAHGQKACVVLATDGLPNDANSFLRALQELQRLPAWLVVRFAARLERRWPTAPPAIPDACASSLPEPALSLPRPPDQVVHRPERRRRLLVGSRSPA